MSWLSVYRINTINDCDLFNYCFDKVEGKEILDYFLSVYFIDCENSMF